MRPLTVTVAAIVLAATAVPFVAGAPALAQQYPPLAGAPSYERVYPRDDPNYRPDYRYEDRDWDQDRYDRDRDWIYRERNERGWQDRTWEDRNPAWARQGARFDGWDTYALRDGRTIQVPPGQFPPSGACRVWYPERPPGQQPPIGECSLLRLDVPYGAVLLEG